jgi:uncharacterized membrane protein
MRIVYLEGDACAPKYVEGTLRRCGLDVQRSEAVPASLAGVDVVVLSDLPVDRLGRDGANQLADAVSRGVGLLLVGGWRSYGRGGWAGTRIEEVSPVTMERGDDRVNAPSGLFLRRGDPHPALDGLPWDEPPVVTGYNRVHARHEGIVVMTGMAVEEIGDEVVALVRDPVPMLVLGFAGKGRTAAFAGDLAPHWSGGLTDWGSPALPVGQGEEVGSAYAALLRQLCGWLGGT